MLAIEVLFLIPHRVITFLNLTESCCNHTHTLFKIHRIAIRSPIPFAKSVHCWISSRTMANSKISLSIAGVAAVLMVCFSPAAVFGARITPAVHFNLQGRVFCDTCRAGFETPATTYIQGAKVEVDCRGKSGVKTCSYDGVTDSSGTYNILVADEHEHEICEVKLVSSPDGSCNSQVPGREKAPVFLSHNNGISSDIRYANALGYQKNTPLAFCSELMKMYQEDDV